MKEREVIGLGLTLWTSARTGYGVRRAISMSRFRFMETSGFKKIGDRHLISEVNEPSIRSAGE